MVSIVEEICRESKERHEGFIWLFAYSCHSPSVRETKNDFHLLFVAYFACFFIQPRTTHPEKTAPTVGWIFSCQEYAPRLAYRPI